MDRAYVHSMEDDEEDDTPVVIPSSAVTTYPKGTPVPTPSIKVQVIEERVDLSNNMTGRQMIGVGVPEESFSPRER